MYQIEFDESWDGYDLVGLKALLNNTTLLFESLVRSGGTGTLLVKRDPQNAPRVDYVRTETGAIVIRLNCPNQHWANFAYQYLHELCHVVMNFTPESRHKWFEETACELASIATMRLMSRAWQVAPPFPNWSSYAPHLLSYAEGVLADREDPSDFVHWFSGRLYSLYANPTDRRSNRTIVWKLLPVFERDLDAWTVIPTFNTWADTSTTFGEFLLGWKNSITQSRQRFIDQIGGVFGIQLVEPDPAGQQG